MKTNLFVALLITCSLGSVSADTFTVTNTNATGAGSLVQAVAAANAHPNIDANTPDIVDFDIPASDPNRDPVTGVFTITPAFPALAPITDPVIIDGYTQGSSTGTTTDDAKPNTLAVGNNAVLLIELNAAGTGGVAGVEFRAGSEGSTVRGLIINRCNGCKAVALGAGKIKVFGNFLGTDSTGTVALGNQWGVNSVGPGGNQIGSPAVADRNLISGNTIGMTLTNLDSETDTVQNNYIGVNATGNVALPNSTGVVISGNFGGGAAGPTIIGGSTATPGRGVGNVISGNTFDGLLFSVSGSSVQGAVTIQGNLIGLGIDGTTAVGNGIGINDVTDFSATLGATLIGGTSAMMRNIISGNNGGISYASANTTVQGNYIGTDVSGTLDRGNATLGLEIVGDHRSSAFPSATNITIGGTVAGAGNLISGNDFGGIWIRNGDATIQGNKIGTQIDGVSALGNSGEGVRVFNVVGDPVLAVAVGGMADGAGNTIAYNGGVGVSVEASTVTILRNSIFNNGSSDPLSQLGLGIDLGFGGPGVTPNDAGDVDTGPNGFQNFPVLTKIAVGSSEVDVIGTLDSMPNTTYRVEFFGNESIDPSNFGEGKTFLGFSDITTDGSGHVDFNVSVPLGPGALHVTSTATDPGGNTSEFSASVGQLLNISTRLGVLSGDNVGIGGFIVTGPDPKLVIVRGIGPSLGGIGVGGALADPTLELRAADGTLIASNDNWKSDQQTEIEGTGLQPTNDLESAIVATLPAAGASYTAVLQGKNGATGVGLIEAYDLDTAANSQLANISTRGFVDTGDNAMIGGFILGGGTAEVIVRAIGPSLTAFGVAGALQDPTLELYDLFGTLIVSNDDWKDTQQTEITASGLAPTNDKESAILMTLGSGAYTAIVRGQGNTTGVGLVEIYNLN